MYVIIQIEIEFPFVIYKFNSINKIHFKIDQNFNEIKTFKKLLEKEKNCLASNLSHSLSLSLYLLTLVQIMTKLLVLVNETI